MSQEKKKLCFVLMPFKENMKQVYDDAIRPAIEQAGFTSLRVDELKGSFNINKKIIEFIFSSDAILADLTNWNPNVFYEMGVAHAIGNKTIMIIQKKDELPFDVKTYRVIQYEQTKLGLEKLKSHIIDHLVCIDEWQKEPTNPVQDFKPHDAFIPRSDFLSVQKLLDEAKERLNQAIDPQKYQAKIEEIKSLKKELDSLHQFQKVVGSKEKDFLKQIQSLSDDKNLALNEVAQLEKQIVTLKTELQQARQERQEKSAKISATPQPTPFFRTEATTLSEDDVKAMLKKHNFFDSNFNKNGKSLKHQFETKIIQRYKVVFDGISGLMWQQGGSLKGMGYDEAKKVIEQMNEKAFAGYKDWRLPTLEEAMSLMEPKKNKNGLYIDPIFDATQYFIWTSDPLQDELEAWVVSFGDARCYGHYFHQGLSYLRVVRFGQSSPE